jgi:hypothetical protein
MTEKRYRVMVEEITVDGDGDDTYRTVVELMATADVLGAFAPAAVSQALGVSVPAPLPVHVAEPDVEVRTEPVAAPVEKTKRTRRTKEQIAADEAAKTAGQASVTTSFEGAAPVPAEAPSPGLVEGGPVFNPFAPK